MEHKLIKAEKDYLNRVVEELGKFNIDASAVEEVKDQILEHIQESRERGEESLAELDEPTVFVKEYLEVQRIESSSSVKGDRKKSRSTLIGGLIAFAVTFVICRLLLSMIPTNLFPVKKNDLYVIFYISDTPWWDALLTFISFVIALITSECVVAFIKRKSTHKSI